MRKLKFFAMPDRQVAKYRTGKPDENNQAPENTFGGFCRYCLQDIHQDEASLLLAYRPFNKINPYAESGPIFIHAGECDAFAGECVPGIITNREQVLIRGYDYNERIVEGTGQVINSKDLEEKVRQTLNQESVEFIHIRSATNNCYYCRVELE